MGVWDVFTSLFRPRPPAKGVVIRCYLCNEPTDTGRSAILDEPLEGGGTWTVVARYCRHCFPTALKIQSAKDQQAREAGL